MKKIVTMFLIVAFGLVATSNNVRAQANKTTTAVARKALPKSNQQDLGKTWMDQADEQALIQFLGIEAVDVNPPAMRIAVDDLGDTGGSGGGGGGGGGGTGPVGTGGSLLAVSRIQSQNFKGIFQNVGTIDLPAFIDETWSAIESSVAQGIEDQLTNTHRSLTGPDLQGFYNIQISLTGLSQASRAVYVWPDNRKARLTLTLPNNVITCRANLNNWPDRDVGIRTNIHLDIDIKLTDTFSDPTQIVSSAVRFSGSEAWNDGILYEDTFNAELEADFNATNEDVPAALVDLLFTADNNLLASKTSASTRSIQFQYLAAEKRLNFKIFNQVKVVSPVVVSGSVTVKRTAQ